MRKSLLQALRDRQKPKDVIIDTKVDAVLTNRRVVVKGQVVPLSGLGAPNVGDVVPVVFRGTKAILAILHRVRRAKAGWLRPTGDVIEELFIATDPATGKREVWFRNEAQVTMLDLRKILPGDPEYVKWGSRGDAFFVRTAGHVYHIFSLERQDPDKSVGRADASATLVRTDTPTTSGVPLTTVAGGWGWRGDRVYLEAERITDALTDAGEPGGGPQSCTLAPRVLGVSSLIGVSTAVSLSPAMFSGPNPIINIVDVELDDRRHLIVVLAVDLGRALPTTLRVPGQHFEGTFDGYTDFEGVVHPDENIWNQDLRRTFSELRPLKPFGGFAVTEAPDDFPVIDDSHGTLITQAQTVRSGRHLYVVDLTAAAVLWGTTVAAPTISTEQRWDEFWCIAHHVISTNYDEFGDPVVSEFSIFEDFRDNACVDNPNMSVTPVLLEIERAGKLMTLAATRSEVAAVVGSDNDQLQNVGASSSDVLLRRQLGGAFATDTFGVACAPITLRTTTGVTTTQKYFHDFSGVYVPRRQTVGPDGQPMGTPLGVLYVFVRRVRLDTPSQAGVAVFAVDIATGQLAEILPMTATAASAQVFGGGYQEFPQVIPISQNTHRVLWRRRLGVTTGSETDAVLLSARSPVASREVLSVSNPAYNPFADPAPAAKAPLIELLKRNLTLLSPDFLYWAEDRADERGNVFVTGWDLKTKELTLPASAATAPPPDDDLDRLGVLAELPTSVTPQRAKGVPTLYGIQDGNVAFVPGPSYRVVNDERVFSARGRFIEEPEPTS